MINYDIRLLPRTYSIKSYKIKNTVGLKQIIKFMLIAAAILFVLGITALSLYNMV